MTLKTTIRKPSAAVSQTNIGLDKGPSARQIHSISKAYAEIESLKKLAHLAPHEIMERLNSMKPRQTRPGPVPVAPDPEKERYLALLDENEAIINQQLTGKTMN